MARRKNSVSIVAAAAGRGNETNCGGRARARERYGEKFLFAVDRVYDDAVLFYPMEIYFRSLHERAARALLSLNLTKVHRAEKPDILR